MQTLFDAVLSAVKAGHAKVDMPTGTVTGMWNSDYSNVTGMDIFHKMSMCIGDRPDNGSTYSPKNEEERIRLVCAATNQNPEKELKKMRYKELAESASEMEGWLRLKKCVTGE